MPRDKLISMRRGTAAAWTSANPTLDAGEPGFETDTLKLKIGDGTTAWTSLAYQGGTGGTTLTADEIDAIQGAAAPDAGNVFATMADVAAGGGGVTEMAYVEFTGSVSITGTTEGTANSIVSAGSAAFDGATRVCIEFFCPQISLPGAGNSMNIVLFDGATSLGRAVYENVAAPNGGPPVLMRRFLTPSNASHTYSIAAYRGSANGSMVAGAGGAGNRLPGYIRITSGG